MGRLPQAGRLTLVQLSPHFQLGEFAVSSTHPELAAAVPAHLIPTVRRLVLAVLEPARAALGVPLRIVSGYRSAALNHAVGGSPTSQHRVAQAADVVPCGATPLELFRVLMGGAAVDHWQLGQVIWYPSRGFVHVALPGARYPRASFHVHEPTMSLHYRPVATADEAAALAAGRGL